MLKLFWTAISRLLSLANSGMANAPWHMGDRRPLFYAFKDRFLMRYGTPDGYDRQDLTLRCFPCNGTGTYDPCRGCSFMGPCSYCNRDRHDTCWKCGGSGIFDRRVNWLARYRVGAQVFHVPVPTYRLPVLINPPVVVFTEKIKHPPVDARKAWWCALVLFAVFEPRMLVKYAIMRVRETVESVWRRVRGWWIDRKLGPVPF